MRPFFIIIPNKELCSVYGTVNKKDIRERFGGLRPVPFPMFASTKGHKMSALIQSLEDKRVVPLVQSDDPKDCLEAIAKEFPHAHVGAGTVISADQSREVIRRGASFIVSPGLDPASVKVAQDADIPILPGISTATELQQAWNLGLRTVKLFPASLVGGPKMLKALSSVFRDVRFMPTGGVNPQTLADYLAVPAVLACGGSWLTPKDAIAAGDFAAITTLAKEAIALAQQ